MFCGTIENASSFHHSTITFGQKIISLNLFVYIQRFVLLYLVRYMLSIIDNLDSVDIGYFETLDEFSS